MRYALMLILFPHIASSACFENYNLETIDYWYYHDDGSSKCMEKSKIKPSESICNTEKNRNYHFAKKNIPEAEWMYYDYEDIADDKLVFKDDILLVNNKVIEGKKTTRNLSESKAIEFCNETAIAIDEKQCTTDDVNFDQQKQIVLAVINYIFSEYNKKDLFYQEITIDSVIVDLTTELHHLKIEKKQSSISYRFNKFRKCGDYLVVNLISYSAPKASSEKVFILKKLNNGFEVIKEDMLWIS